MLQTIRQHLDKAGHIAVGFLICVNSALVFLFLLKALLLACMGGFALAALAGYLKECWDENSGEAFDKWDMYCTWLGGAWGIMVILILM